MKLQLEDGWPQWTAFWLYKPVWLWFCMCTMVWCFSIPYFIKCIECDKSQESAFVLNWLSFSLVFSTKILFSILCLAFFGAAFRLFCFPNMFVSIMYGMITSNICLGNNLSTLCFPIMSKMILSNKNASCGKNIWKRNAYQNLNNNSSSFIVLFFCNFLNRSNLFNQNMLY